MVKRKDSDKMQVPVGANNHSPVQAPAIPVDEFHGMGGSYILDPVAGTRIRVAGPAAGADGIRPNEQPETEQPQGEALANESE